MDNTIPRFQYGMQRFGKLLFVRHKPLATLHPAAIVVIMQ
jgi:hypothetical protein